MGKLSEESSIRRLLLLFFSLSILLSSGCGLSDPIIVNPPEGWEEEAERGMMRSKATPTPKPHVASSDGIPSRLPNHEEHNAFVTALADIIGYPFRAVGYLVHELL